MASTRPPLIVWASRGAGVMGVGSAVLYMGMILGGDDPSRIPLALGFFALMVGAGLAAWFADRAPSPAGRRLMWGAFAVFFVLGVLSIFTLGILFLIAAVLSIFSLSRGASVRRPESTDDPRGDAGT